MRCYDQILRQPVWTLRRHKTGRIRVAHNIPDIGKRCRQANELQIQPFCSLEKQKLVDEQLEEITSGSIADHVRLIDDNRPILPNGLGLYEVVDDVVRLLVVEKYEQLHSVLRGKEMNGERIKVGCYYGNKVCAAASCQE